MNGRLVGKMFIWSVGWREVYMAGGLERCLNGRLVSKMFEW